MIVADDLGRSSSTNLAIAEAHDTGILTAASIMAGGEAFEEAVKIALARRLSIGLHITLCDGRAVLPQSQIPGLVDSNGWMEKSPSLAWLRFRKPGFLSQIDAEVGAQFDRVEEAGLCISFVNSHHHLHMHPSVFEIVCRHASKRGISWIRVPAEPISIVVGFRSPSRGLMPFIEWAVFGMLTRYNLRMATRYGMRADCGVYGLSRAEDVDEEYLIGIVNHFRNHVNEIFLHPDTATVAGRQELGALTSDKVRGILASRGIVLTGYGELSGSFGTQNCGQDIAAFEKMRGKG